MARLPEILQTKAGDRHLYAVGRIRVLETHLLDRDILKNLIEAGSVKEVYNELRDTIYGEGVVETEENLDFERMLQYEKQSIINLIDSISPDPYLTDLFVYSFDVQNIKMLFKEKLGKALEPWAFYVIGRFDISTLRELVQTSGGETLPVPKWMIAASEELEKAWKDYPKLRVVDAVWDRALATAQLEDSIKYKRPILTRFFRFNLDIHNVEAFIRIHISERSKKQFKQFFIPGGSLSFSFFEEVWGTKVKELGRHFKNTQFHTMVTKSLEEYQTEGSLTMMEMEEARLQMEQLAPARYITFGPEPILAYLVTRLFEIKILRRIMVAKKNNLSVEDLRKRVMTFYA